MVQLRTLPAITFENVWCHKLVDWIQGLLSKRRIPQVPATAEHHFFGTCKNFDLQTKAPKEVSQVSPKDPGSSHSVDLT